MCFRRCRMAYTKVTKMTISHRGYNICVEFTYFSILRKILCRLKDNLIRRESRGRKRTRALTRNN